MAWLCWMLEGEGALGAVHDVTLQPLGIAHKPDYEKADGPKETRADHKRAKHSSTTQKEAVRLDDYAQRREVVYMVAWSFTACTSTTTQRQRPNAPPPALNNTRGHQGA